MMEQMFATFGQLIINSGIGAGVAYLLFRFLGQRWIESRFERSLENYRHENAKEIERLKIEVDSSLDSVLRIQEREFSCLEEAWDRLQNLHDSTRNLISPLQMYQDINRMSDEMAQEYLTGFDILESQKNQILDASDKTAEWGKVRFLMQLNQANSDYAKFVMHLNRSCIFLNQETEVRLRNIQYEFNHAITDKSIGDEARDYKMQQEAWKRLKDKIGPEIDLLKSEIRIKLRRLSRE